MLLNGEFDITLENCKTIEQHQLTSDVTANITSTSDKQTIEFVHNGSNNIYIGTIHGLYTVNEATVDKHIALQEDVYNCLTNTYRAKDDLTINASDDVVKSIYYQTSIDDDLRAPVIFINEFDVELSDNLHIVCALNNNDISVDVIVENFKRVAETTAGAIYTNESQRIEVTIHYISGQYRISFKSLIPGMAFILNITDISITTTINESVTKHIAVAEDLTTDLANTFRTKDDLVYENGTQQTVKELYFEHRVQSGSGSDGSIVYIINNDIELDNLHITCTTQYGNDLDFEYNECIDKFKNTTSIGTQQTVNGNVYSIEFRLLEQFAYELDFKYITSATSSEQPIAVENIKLTTTVVEQVVKHIALQEDINSSGVSKNIISTIEPQTTSLNFTTIDNEFAWRLDESEYNKFVSNPTGLYIKGSYIWMDQDNVYLTTCDMTGIYKPISEVQSNVVTKLYKDGNTSDKMIILTPSVDEHDNLIGGCDVHYIYLYDNIFSSVCGYIGLLDADQSTPDLTQSVYNSNVVNTLVDNASLRPIMSVVSTDDSTYTEFINLLKYFDDPDDEYKNYYRFNISAFAIEEGKELPARSYCGIYRFKCKTDDGWYRLVNEQEPVDNYSITEVVDIHPDCTFRYWIDKDTSSESIFTFKISVFIDSDEKTI